jgi:hypothetical protein
MVLVVTEASGADQEVGDATISVHICSANIKQS